MIKHIFIFLLLAFLFKCTSAQTGHHLLTNGGRLTLGKCIPTSDNGYMAVGSLDSGNLVKSGILVKLDSSFKTTYAFKVDFPGSSISENVLAATETSDGGFAFAACNSVNGIYFVIHIFKTDAFGKLIWSKEINPGNNRQYPHRIVDDERGNLFVMGHTAKYPTPTNTHAFLYKMDYSGNVFFSNTYSNSNTTGITDISFGLNGEIFASTYGGQGVLNHQLIKMDSIGNVLWTKDYISSKNAVAHNILRISSSEFIIIGNSKDSPSGRQMVSILKVDTAGTLIWSKLIGNSLGNLSGQYAALLTNGNIAIAATKNIPFNSGPFMLCIDTSGTIVWSRSSSIGSSNVIDVNQTADGDLLFAGWMDNPIGIQQDLLLIKTAVTGNTLDTCINTSDMSTSVPSISSSNITTTRVPRSPFTVNPVTLTPLTISSFKNCVVNKPTGKSGVVQTGHHIITNGGWLDLGRCIPTSDKGYLLVGGIDSATTGKSAFIAKLDSGLNKVWASKLDFVAVNSAEQIIAADENADGGFAFAGINFTSGKNIIEIFKTDSAGKILWSKAIDPGSNRQALQKVVDDDQGNFYVMGFTAKYPQIANTQAFLYKLDYSGNIIFSNTYYNANTTVFADLKFGDHGELYASGYGGVGGSLNHQLFKMDSLGNILWSRAYTSNRDAGANNLFKVINGFLLIGNSWDAPSRRLSSSIVRVDTNGILMWSKLLSNSSENLYSKNAFQLSNGNVAIALHKHIPANSGPRMACIDPNGNLLWSRTSNIGRANVFDVNQTVDGKIAFTGWIDVQAGPTRDLLLIETDINGNTADTCLGNDLLTFINPNFGSSVLSTTKVARSPFTSVPITASPMALSSYRNCAVLGPEARFGLKSALCRNECAIVSDSSKYANQYTWTAVGAIPSFSIQKQPSFCFPDTGLFEIKLLVANSIGCDSINYPITVYDQSIAVSTLTSCDGDSLLIGSNWYYSDTVISDTSQNQFDCDSIMRISLIFLPKSSSSESRLICLGDSTFYNNRWLKSRGRYSYTLPASNGCDSLISLNLDYFPDASSDEKRLICFGDSTFFAGSWIVQAGTYSDNYKSQFGCDSTVSLVLEVEKIDTLLGKVGELLFAHEDSASYQWIDCLSDTILQGETAKSFLPLRDGAYAVLISKNACVDTSVCITVVKPVPEGPIRIYPNPVVGNFFKIDLGKRTEKVTVIIHNSLGQVVYEELFFDQFIVDLNLPIASAVYYISVEIINEKAQTYKLIKN